MGSVWRHWRRLRLKLGDFQLFPLQLMRHPVELRLHSYNWANKSCMEAGLIQNKRLIVQQEGRNLLGCFWNDGEEKNTSFYTQCCVAHRRLQVSCVFGMFFS